MAVYDIKISGAQNEKIAKLMGDGEFSFLSSAEVFPSVLPLPPPFHLIFLSLPSYLGISRLATTSLPSTHTPHPLMPLSPFPSIIPPSSLFLPSLLLPHPTRKLSPSKRN
jgi:hypothetical protein